MRIKLLGVLVALLTAGAAFGLSPLANADTSSVDNEMEAEVGPAITSMIQRGQTIDFEWENQGPDVSYTIYRSENGGPFYPRWGTKHKSARDATATGTIAFHIVAHRTVDGQRVSSEPGPARSITKDIFRVEAPQLTVVQEFDNGEVKISFNETGQAKLDIFIDGEYHTTKNLPTDDRTFLISPPAEGQSTVHATVYSRNDAGELRTSSPSNVINVDARNED